MSASGVRELLATVEGVQHVARVYCGVALTRAEAERCTFAPAPPKVQRADPGWMDAPHAVSAGPVIYLKMAIQRHGFSLLTHCGCPDEADDVPLRIRRVRSKSVVEVCPVARSKMWRTPLVVTPIDLTTLRVAGVPR